jgi:hypothetical protein
LAKPIVGFWKRGERRDGERERKEREKKGEEKIREKFYCLIFNSSYNL